MNDLINTLMRIPNAELPTHIDDALVNNLADPESATEIYNQFYFKTGQLHYFTFLKREDLDSRMLHYNNADAYAAFIFSQGFSLEQQRMIESEPFYSGLFRLNFKSKEGELITLARALPIDNVPLDIHTFAGYFSGIRYNSSYMGFPARITEEDLRHCDVSELIRNMQYQEEIDPTPVLQDALPKLKSAVEYFKAKYPRT